MAAPALSWCLSLLVLLLPLAIPQASTVVNGEGARSRGEGWGRPAASHSCPVPPADTSKLTCFYNSKANISCVWSRDDGLQAASCHVHAKSDKRTWEKSCELLPVRSATWACNLILGAPKAQKLTSADTVTLSVRCYEGENRSTVLTQDFKPFENLRLMAPDSFHVVHVETHRCNISWSVSQCSHYIEKYLEFEARMRSPGHSWEEAALLTLHQNQQWICLETLAPDTLYELQVRVRPQLDNLEAWSPWSPWSQPLAFRTRPAAPEKETLPVSWWGHTLVGLTGGSLGFIFLVYLLVNCRYIGLWLKKVLKCHIPDPSEFFSQLSSEHGGDFQLQRPSARDLPAGGAGQGRQGHSAAPAAAGQGALAPARDQRPLADQLLHQPGLLLFPPPGCTGDRGLPGVLHLRPLRRGARRGWARGARRVSPPSPAASAGGGRRLLHLPPRGGCAALLPWSPGWPKPPEPRLRGHQGQ
ncbi:interleukin-2 receptor subunit beta isoform X3 [Equus caballus]|uniref:interleukin-2 receptor subunit beta isoform X3 n=1 Tax=Equus caballus TaxID=9796 RepID=UPI0038B3F49D